MSNPRPRPPAPTVPAPTVLALAVTALVTGILADVARASSCEIPIQVALGIKPNIVVSYDTSASMKINTNGLHRTRDFYMVPADDPDTDGYAGGYAQKFQDLLVAWEAEVAASSDPDFDHAVLVHMNDVHGCRTCPFDEHALYDAADNRVCDHLFDLDCTPTPPASYRLEDMTWPGDSYLSLVAACNLGATHLPSTLDPTGSISQANRDWCENQGASAPNAFDLDYLSANGSNGTNNNGLPNSGRGHSVINPDHDDDDGNTNGVNDRIGTGFFGINSLWSGRYLNYLHASAQRDDVARQAVRDLVNDTKASINWGLMAFTEWPNGTGVEDLGGELRSEIFQSDPVDLDDDSISGGIDLMGALDTFSGALLWPNVPNDFRGSVAWDNTSHEGLIIQGFGQTPLAGSCGTSTATCGARP